MSPTLYCHILPYIMLLCCHDVRYVALLRYSVSMLFLHIFGIFCMCCVLFAQTPSHTGLCTHDPNISARMFQLT